MTIETLPTNSESIPTNTESTSTDSQSTPTDSQSTPTTRKKRTLAEQNLRIANLISDAGILIQTLEADPQLTGLLREKGIDQNEMMVGTDCHAAAQDGFNQRQSTMAEEDAGFVRADRLFAHSQGGFIGFRTLSRLRFPTHADRIALALNGKLPEDRQQCITLMRASYTEALLPRYQQQLTKLGYSAPILTQLLAELDTLEAAIAAANRASGAAQGATRDRNEAVKALQEWMRMVKGTARVALRERPDLLRKLGM